MPDSPQPPRVLKVSATTPPHSLAESIKAALSEGVEVVLHSVGHGAVGQAAKAVPILNTKTANGGVVYLVLISLIDMPDDNHVGHTITVTRFKLVPWNIGG